jgi:hypothetical protein
MPDSPPSPPGEDQLLATSVQKGELPYEDRRRRGGMTYEQGSALKRLQQQPTPKNPSDEEE